MATPSASDVAATVNYRDIRQFLRTIQLKTIPALVAGKPSTIELDRGLTYHRIHLNPTIGNVAVSAADAKAYGSVKAVIDGDPKFDETVDQITAIQDFHNGRNVATGYNATEGDLPIHLAQPWQMEVSGQDYPAWGLAVGGVNGVRNATLSFTSTDLAKIDACQGYAYVSDATYLGRHAKRYHILGNQAGAGDLVIDQWPVKDPSAVIQAIHLKSTLVTHVRLQVDRGDDIEKTAIGALHNEYRQLGKVPQTGWTHICFDGRGRPKDGMPMVFQSGRLVLTTSGALNNYDIILDVLEGVDPA